MSEFPLLIDGKLVAGDATLDVVNPATEAPAGTCSRASEAQLDAAVAAARAAWPAWAATPVAERRAALENVADIVAAHAPELGRILTLEQGKPLKDAVAEAYGLSVFTRHFAAAEFPVEVLEDGETRRVEAHRVPLGVVAAIIPWNFPLVLLGFKLGPALIAGNTLVVKPAPTTPLATLRVGALIADALPPGVVNVIADDNDLGPKLSTHPGIRKVSFTGSTATGARVMAGAAETLKRITLEMGGNDAGIVLGDVDPKEIAPKLFQSAFANCGQICIAMKRLYVHEDVHDAVCDELAEIARSKRVGDGMDDATEIGPLQNRKQYERVKELITEAAEKGTVIAGGGVPERPGYFIEPTIVRDLEEGVRLVDEEQFGPALPVLKFSDPDEVIERVNRCPEGLGGSVWGRDVAEATRLAARMEAGTVWVNKHADLDPGIPFGGAKQSGIGTELGRPGVEEFTQLKVINIAR
ncbi:MAG: aldehyde dehydrogenase family protein [Myxococcota bacterium]|nr:aldehyde dehydrogenase family protein [Myxococcota bacterium]